MKVFIERVRRLELLAASGICLRNGRSKFRQERANFVRWSGAAGNPGGLIADDAKGTTSPATAGDGDFNRAPTCGRGSPFSRSAGV
jgi:hypothetical protein